MIIERTDTEVIIRLPSDVDTIGLERIVRFLKYLESTKDNKANSDEVNLIANESKRRWWSENKHRFIK